jgi:hypothetical protein
MSCWALYACSLVHEPRGVGSSQFGILHRHFSENVHSSHCLKVPDISVNPIVEKKLGPTMSECESCGPAVLGFAPSTATSSLESSPPNKPLSIRVVPRTPGRAFNRPSICTKSAFGKVPCINVSSPTNTDSNSDNNVRVDSAASKISRALLRAV